jgi:hypothetical protein
LHESTEAVDSLGIMVDLGNIATLTMGGQAGGTEDKRYPYG